MAVRIDYKASVEKDLRRINRSDALRILKTIERKLAAEGQSGEPLHGDFAGMYRLRVGSYRLIYARTEEGYLVVRVGHRREVYRARRK